MQAIVPILGSVAIGVVGQLLLKTAMTRIGPLSLGHGRAVNTAFAITFNPGVWLGFSLYGLSMVLWLAGLSQVELGYAIPFLSLSYVFILLGSRIWLGEAIGNMRLIGVLQRLAAPLILASSPGHGFRGGGHMINTDEERCSNLCGSLHCCSRLGIKREIR